MKVNVNSDHPDRGHLAFPHYDEKYKCCCHTVHVKQGTLIIGILCSVLAVFSFFSTVISKETPTIIALQLISLSVEILCLVLLFVALRKNRKLMLIPFGIYQLVSCVMCLILAGLTIWVMTDPDGSGGMAVKDMIVSKEEMELEKGHPEMNANVVIRMAAAFLCTALLLAFCLTAWWITVIYRCYKYMSDMEKNRASFDSAINYNAQQQQVY